MFDPPKCANYECDNILERERWLWTPGGVSTCSPSCAGKVANESRPPFVPELRKCLRCGKRLTTEQVHSGVECCSRSCSWRFQHGEKLGPNLRITPGDRWEKVAPVMVYTPALRGQEIRDIYQEQVSK